ncbi:MAG: hypothetical protein JO301_02620 [Chitinophagaceae bacterium]|nr:hypothetical protein [Chitinophagaceae bacterium]
MKQIIKATGCIIWIFLVCSCNSHSTDSSTPPGRDSGAPYVAPHDSASNLADSARKDSARMADSIRKMK